MLVNIACFTAGAIAAAAVATVRPLLFLRFSNWVADKFKLR